MRLKIRGCLARKLTHRYRKHRSLRGLLSTCGHLTTGNRMDLQHLTPFPSFLKRRSNLRHGQTRCSTGSTSRRQRTFRLLGPELRSEMSQIRLTVERCCVVWCRQEMSWCTRRPTWFVVLAPRLMRRSCLGCSPQLFLTGSLVE